MSKFITTLVLVLGLILPTYAHDNHHKPPEPINVPNDGSNHNALAMAVIVGIGVCVYYKCWKPKPVKAEASITPEIPQNEYITIRPRR
jgi:hypothetical protein